MSFTLLWMLSNQGPHCHWHYDYKSVMYGRWCFPPGQATFRLN